ncbi:DUSP23 [Cordylochernes scorpioides]|uniref:DUSP23 n=1 Tax=Cordylochernes scorpioides TaxID=51811 RepID=A0ABY6KVF7_9ARAC|nr:DUSP23 [Cordylochernes scorpioides]
MVESRSDSVEPPNFSWVDAGRLAAMGWPRHAGHLNFLRGVGVRHLVTLSPECVPPDREGFQWRALPVPEFEAPSLDQIQAFMALCEDAQAEGEATPGVQKVGVHCRQGFGRTGVMAACYLVRFRGLGWREAVAELRASRPWSLETREQEQAVQQYDTFFR